MCTALHDAGDTAGNIIKAEEIDDYTTAKHEEPGMRWFSIILQLQTSLSYEHVDID